MSFLNRVAFLGCVVFFSGSMVVVGARNLKDSLKPHDEKDQPRAQRLIEVLRGDELYRIEAKYAAPPSAPARHNGSVIPNDDKQMLKSLLRRLLGGVGDDPKGEQTGQETEEVAQEESEEVEESEKEEK